MRIISWNIGRRVQPWRDLADDATVDVALLQEATRPAVDLGLEVTPARNETWATVGSGDFTTAIAWRSGRVNVRPRRLGAIGDSAKDCLPVSRSGTLTAVDVDLSDGPASLVSAYAFWERPCGEKLGRIYADASAHRLVSDISGLLATNHRHRVIVAGDFNIFYGHGEGGSVYWKERYASVFARFEALGMKFVGPQFPDGGRQADSRPDTLPAESMNVPTFYSNRQKPATATWQLDFVFASRSLSDRIRVRALNAIEEWGPSDHCRIEIVIDQ